MNKVSHDESERILDVGQAHELALAEHEQREEHWTQLAELERQVGATVRLMNALRDSGHVDPDPARPMDDTVDSEPHPDERDWVPFDEGEYESDSNRPDVLAAIERATDDDPGRDQHGRHDRGARYIADPADYIGLPAPDFHPVAEAALLNVPGADGEREPTSAEMLDVVSDFELEVRVGNTMYEVEQGNMRRRTAARQIIRQVREAAPLLPYERFLAESTAKSGVSLDTRLALGRILVEHRNRDGDTADAIGQIVALFAAEASPPVSAEGPTVSVAELTAERFGPTGAQA
jgi:hypothetical protein